MVAGEREEGYGEGKLGFGYGFNNCGYLHEYQILEGVEAKIQCKMYRKSAPSPTSYVTSPLGQSHTVDPVTHAPRSAAQIGLPFGSPTH